MHLIGQMTQTPEETLRQNLGRGERLLWSGKPQAGIRLRPQDSFAIPFSLFWCGFAIFWNVAVWHSGAPLAFQLFGIPFIFVGLYLVFGRFFVDAKTRERTAYGVTNDRVLIVSGLLSQRLKSLQLKTLADVTLTQGKDGRGTLTFGQNQSMSPFFGRIWWGYGQYGPPAFETIEDAKNVYDIVGKAQKAAFAVEKTGS